MQSENEGGNIQQTEEELLSEFHNNAFEQLGKSGYIQFANVVDMEAIIPRSRWGRLRDILEDLIE